MRLLLTLELTGLQRLPLNYNYPLSSAIYKLLKFGSPEFADFLHNTGYKLNGKRYKLFSFALKPGEIKFGNNCINLSSRIIKLYVTSPLVDNFIHNFVIGSFNNRIIQISDSSVKSSLLIKQVETISEPVFTNKASFRLVSPMVLSTIRKNENGSFQYYFRYSDDIKEINRVFTQNLKNKYELIYSNVYNGPGIELNWDKKYIAKKKAENKRLTKKISVVKKGELPVEIIGIEVPFILTGDADLMKVGYECGFGEKNSMGFGLTVVS